MALKVHAEKFTEKLNYALKEANDAKLAQKEEKDQVFDLKERIKKKLKLATLKISARLNMQRLSEEHNEVLKSSKKNGTE